MSIKTYPYDSARFLDSEEAIAEFMDEARQIGDPAFVEHAARVAARARVLHGLAT